MIKLAVYLGSNNLLSDAQTDRILNWVIANKYQYILRSFLNTKLPTTQTFANNLLLGAIRTKDFELVKLPVDTDLDFQRRNASVAPIELAVSGGNVEIARVLLAGGPFNDNASIARATLPSAIRDGNTEMVKLLLEFSPAGAEDLLDAAEWGRIEITRIIIAAGVDVNERYLHCKPALQAAVWRGSVETAKLLLEAGTTVNAAESHERTPLGIASLAKIQR